MDPLSPSMFNGPQVQISVLTVRQHLDSLATGKGFVCGSRGRVMLKSLPLSDNFLGVDRHPHTCACSVYSIISRTVLALRCWRLQDSVLVLRSKSSCNKRKSSRGKVAVGSANFYFNDLWLPTSNWALLGRSLRPGP